MKSDIRIAVLYFVRNKGEWREIIIDRNDNTYRLYGMTATYCPKRHENANEYIKSIIEKGWRKCSYREYLQARYLGR